MLAKAGILIPFGLVMRLRIAKISIISGMERIVMKNPRIVVNWIRLRISKKSIVKGSEISLSGNPELSSIGFVLHLRVSKRIIVMSPR